MKPLRRVSNTKVQELGKMSSAFRAKSAARQRPEGGFSLVECATLLYRKAWGVREEGSVADAKSLTVKSECTEDGIGQEARGHFK